MEKPSKKLLKTIYKTLFRPIESGFKEKHHILSKWLTRAARFGYISVSAGLITLVIAPKI